VLDFKNSATFADLALPQVAAFIGLGFRQLQIFEDGKAILQGRTAERVLAGNIADALQAIQLNV
jgi:hypothetical protein